MEKKEEKSPEPSKKATLPKITSPPVEASLSKIINPPKFKTALKKDAPLKVAEPTKK